jgi:hypothetical protein
VDIPGYDDWKLRGPDEGPQEPGQEDGEICGRYEEPDEDAPRGYKPKPCEGEMLADKVVNCSCHINPPCGACVDAGVTCDTCGYETAPQEYEPYEFPEPHVVRDRSSELTSTHTANPYNSTPFTQCCGVAAINTDRCPLCKAKITYHDDGLAARRREVGPGNCLMCGKKRGTLGVQGNCCC